MTTQERWDGALYACVTVAALGFIGWVGTVLLFCF